MRRFGRGVRLAFLTTFASFGVGAGLTWYFRETVFNWLTAPAAGMLSPHDGLPVYTTLTEMMGATLRLSFHGGLVVAFPVAVLSIFYMVRPVLPRKKRRTVALYLPLILLLFAAGNAFAYWVMLPTGIQYLLKFGEGVAVPTIRISSYLALVEAMIFWLGIIFELPLLMMLTTKVQVVSHEQFKRARRYVPWVALVLAAIITPTMDIVNMLLVAAPIILLYEIGAMLSWLVMPGNGTIMLGRMKALAIWFLRRLAVLIVAVTILAIRLVYVIALTFVDLIDGHHSADTPSRSKAWVDRVYRWWLRAVERVVRL